MPRERWKTILAVVAVAALVVVVVASVLVIFVFTPSTSVATNHCAPPATAPETIAPGWEASFRAGCPDLGGNMTGGSEMMHLVAHDGMLFAAVGYWEDRTNIYYGGTNSSQGWAQILRLPGPNTKWVVDLTMTGVVRPEILKSVTFSTDGAGEPLGQPVNLLLAAGCVSEAAGVNLYTRNDTTGHWVTSNIVPGPTGQGCGNMSVRAMTAYQDPITGVDRLFVSIGDLGVFSGVYDPAAPGDILWNRTSESGSLPVRPLAIVEANGNLLFSSGALIYQRVNGPSPSWKDVVNESALPGGTDINPAVGGIRGLTPIPNPTGPGQSMLLLWCPNNSSTGEVVRLDPNGTGGYTTTIEVDVASLVSKYLNTPTPFILGAYNDFLPVTDPSTGNTVYVFGMEAWISKSTGLPTIWGDSTGGMYQGALYAIRYDSDTYKIGQVNGIFPTGNPPLVSTRTYATSPFPSDNGSVIYFGGYDANGHLCLDTAWVFKTTIANALGEVENGQAIPSAGSVCSQATEPFLMRPRLFSPGSTRSPSKWISLDLPGTG
ncbi:MAG TPA: hypothetical protein VEH57_04145 [Thermoplasmata archaeon]|nr:hypothetical protein [Thermoplasmata archaeon]